MRCYTSRSVQTAASLIFVAAPINHERVLQMNISSFLNHLNGVRILALPLCLCLVFGSTLLSTAHAEVRSISEGAGLSVSESGSDEIVPAPIPVDKTGSYETVTAAIGTETGSDETAIAAIGTETGSDETAQVPIPVHVVGKTASDETVTTQVETEGDTTAQSEGEFRIARVRYRGGGDWYSSPTALTNLLRHMKDRLPVSISDQYDDVSLDSRELHRYPLLYISGHGNIEINEREMENLRSYLQNGGFLFVDDDYAMDQYVRPILQSIFPDQELVELPGDHPIYRLVYEFPDGRPPKVHEHDGLPPQAFGLFHDARLVVLYTYESNPSDGWAYDEHPNPDEIVEASLQFGINVLTWVFTSPE